MKGYEGGRFFGEPCLIRTGIHRHTANGGFVSDTTLAALNAIQATAWEINAEKLGHHRDVRAPHR